MNRLFSLWVVCLASCTPEPKPASPPADDPRTVVEQNLSYRTNRETFFRQSPQSPFNRDSTVEFREIRWFPVDPRFRGYSILHRYFDPVVIDVAATGGEVRKQIRYGYFELAVPDSGGETRTIRLNAYKFAPQESELYSNFPNALSIWFTDETTGIETYGVGRYLEVGDERNDPDHLYLIDLNMAYNPFCAYSPLFSCAIPRKEDYIAVPLRVGEKNYEVDG